jgi:hypothetical protein
VSLDELKDKLNHPTLLRRFVPAKGEIGFLQAVPGFFELLGEGRAVNAVGMQSSAESANGRYVRF